MADLEDPYYLAQDRGPTILVIIWTLTAIASIFVLARLFVRLHILDKAGLDDLLIFASMLVEILYASLVTVSIHAGYGRHAETLTPQQLQTAELFNAASFAPGILGFTLPKLTVAALLIRLQFPSRAQSFFLWVLTTGTTILALGCVVILFAQCHPMLWIDDPNKKCWSPSILVDYSIAVGSLSAAVDLYLAIYPALILAKLHINRKKKVGLSVAMGLGAVASIMAIVKCTRIPVLLNRDDSTYATADLFIWTNVEATTIIIAASIPTLAPLVDLLFGKRALSSTNPYDDLSNKRSSRNIMYIQRSTKVEVEVSQNRTLSAREDGSQEDILMRTDILATWRQDDVVSAV